MGRAEWIGFAVFAAVGLGALPWVRDTVLVQQLWTTLCGVVGISGCGVRTLRGPVADSRARVRRAAALDAFRRSVASIALPVTGIR